MAEGAGLPSPAQAVLVCQFPPPETGETGIWIMHCPRPLRLCQRVNFLLRKFDSIMRDTRAVCARKPLLAPPAKGFSAHALSARAKPRHTGLGSGRGGGIRTHGTFRYAGFQDRCIRPLCHPSAIDGGRFYELPPLARHKSGLCAAFKNPLFYGFGR